MRSDLPSSGWGGSPGALECAQKPRTAGGSQSGRRVNLGSPSRPFSLPLVIPLYFAWAGVPASVLSSSLSKSLKSLPVWARSLEAGEHDAWNRKPRCVHHERQRNSRGPCHLQEGLGPVCSL